MKLFLHILTILLGAVFVFSAIVKLYPLDAFELYVYSFEFLSWNITEIAVRLLVVFELALGLLLIASVKKKQLLYVAVSTLVLFTIFLLAQYFSGYEENCHCFGELMPMSPLQSIIKNCILIAIGIFLLVRYVHGFTFRFKKLIAYGLVLGAVVFVFSVNVPDSWLKGLYIERKINSKEFPAEILSKYTNEDLTHGKKIICMFSVGCKYCQLAARKITAIDGLLEKDVDILYFMLGSEDKMDMFWEKSKSKKFPYAIVSFIDFFNVSDNKLPTIFYINNGIIEKKVGFRTLFEDEVKEFVEKE